MLDNFRQFQVGPDPFGRTWQVHFSWLQTGISIRHADTVDVKFGISTSQEGFDERVIALPHPVLLAVSKKVGHALTDAWCMKIAALHLQHMLETGEDIEKTLVTVPAEEIEHYARQLQDALATAK
jgi:pyruvate/2-oxoacid:ferredoxin oxidoreductase beta subunit